MAARLQFDLLKLYTSAANADVTFKFPDGEIRAHKVNLTTRVPYFEKMFSSGFKESLTGNVNLPEDDKESFDIFLRFIYGAQLPNSFDVERQLHYAKMYDVPDLVSQCLPMLKRHLFRFQSFEECVNESARLLTMYELAAANPIFEEVLLERMDVAFCDLAICGNCARFFCQRRHCATPKQDPATAIDHLVKLLLLADSKKLATLKERCLLRFCTIDPKGLFKTHFAEAMKRMKEHPDLLMEMVLRYRTGK